MEPAGALQPTLFGRYRLSSRLATGGMAEVYVGRRVGDDGTLGPMVAVKRLLPHHVKAPAIVRMFLNEARITSQIHHPNVVSIVELGQVGAEPFIAMELLNGKSFEELRASAAGEGHRVPMPVSLFILIEACRGLDAAHHATDEEGKPLAVVHRDFTPDNVHVGFDGQVKVIDFGIARTATWGSGTEPGILKGKFFYMSPEMVLARPVDHRADLFAAGVMLYEQLCGRRPFTGMTVDEVLKKIARTDPAPPTQFDPAVPKAVEAVVMRALHKDPAQRFQTLGELVDALTSIVGLDIATPEQVSAYMHARFPPEQDERQQALAHAREIDPSLPGGRGPVFPPEAFADTSPSAKARPVTGAGAAATAQPPPPVGASGAQASAGSSPGVPRGSGVSKPAPAPHRVAALTLGLVVVGALAGVGVMVATHKRPATEVLTEALAEKDPAARARKVADLATYADATDEQLDKAGAALLAAREFDRAAAFADAWQKRSPQVVEAALLQAEALVGLRQGKKAEAALKAAGLLAPTDERVDLTQARLREVQGDLNGAVEALERAHKKRPTDASITLKLGQAQSQSGRLDDAAHTLEPLVKQSRDPEAAAELGFVRFRKEQRDDAQRLLAEAVKTKPDLMVGHYYLAAVLYAKGDIDGARREYERADELAGPDSRPLEAWCELEKQQESPRLDEVKKRLGTRFGKDGEALAKKCAP